MDRRHLLHLAAGGVTGLAGCGARGRGPGADAVESPPPGSSPPGSPTPGGGTGGAAGRIDASVATSRYLVTSFEQTPDDRAIDPEAVVPASELPDPLRSALESARDGGYETEVATPELLAGVDRFRHHGIGYRFEPYVRLDGTPYAFDPTVPVFVARLDSDVEDVEPDRTVGHDDLERVAEPVRDFVRTIGAFSAESPRDEYRISVVPAPVRTFLDRYEYVRDPEDVGRIVAERVDPGPPYTIELRELTTEDLWGRPVVEGGSLPADLRRFLGGAVASDRRAPALPPTRSEYRTDEVPGDYYERLRTDDPSARPPYVDLDGTIYAFRVRHVDRSKLPVAVSVSPGPHDDPATFSVTLEPSERGPKPAIDGPLEIASSGALPSVLWVETGDERILLPSDAYESVSWEPTEGSASVDRRVRNVARGSHRRGESLAATYRVPDLVPAGTYRSWGRFGVSWTEAGSGRRFPTIDYPFQVVLTVRES